MEENKRQDEPGSNPQSVKLNSRLSNYVELGGGRNSGLSVTHNDKLAHALAIEAKTAQRLAYGQPILTRPGSGTSKKTRPVAKRLRKRTDSLPAGESSAASVRSQQYFRDGRPLEKTFVYKGDVRASQKSSSQSPARISNKVRESKNKSQPSDVGTQKKQ